MSRSSKPVNKQTPDLFSPLQADIPKRRVLTVSEVTQDIKLILEQSFERVWIEGEVSGVSRIATGTVFFNLKDSLSLLKCVMFSAAAAGLKFELKDGMQILCAGRISVYEKEGKYQLYAQEAEPKGVGGLQLALEQLKVKLEKEGLFSPARKRQIPFLPSRIGVVTSPQGAAIKDIFKVLERRFKGVNLIINPVRVQGEGAKDEIAQAINEFNDYNKLVAPEERIDVMIVGRGGGSTEDLWAFNAEVVARAIHQSQIPVISAVGHERDWTIADLVADVRAPTPSVAAELVIPKREDLRERVEDINGDLGRLLEQMVIRRRQDIDELAYRLKLGYAHSLELTQSRLQASVKKLDVLNPVFLLVQHDRRLKDLMKQMQLGAAHLLALKESGCKAVAGKLHSLSPLQILARGYSITFSAADSIIKDSAMVKPGDTLKTQLRRGTIISVVKDVAA